MQSTFSFYRLGLLIRKQWAERSRLYLLMMGAIAGLLVIAFFLWFISNDGVLWIEPTHIFLFVGLFLGGCILAGMTFSELAQRTTGIYYLVVPATQAEKLVCGILFSQVFFNLAYLGIFFLIRTITFSIVAMYPHMHLGHISNEMNSGQFLYYISLVYLGVQTFYLLGSVYFERFAFVKTTLAGVLIVILIAHFFHYIAEPIAPHNLSIQDGMVKVNGSDGYWYTYSFSPWLYSTGRFALQFVWVPVFWVATYFRLKEKEI